MHGVRARLSVLILRRAVRCHCRSGAQREALTFPTDAPMKRIDFVIVGGARATPVAAFTVGGEPAAGSVTEASATAGMLGEGSAVFASDHLALVVDVDIDAGGRAGGALV